MISELAFEPVLDAAQAGASWARTRLYEWLAPPVSGYLRAQGIADPADATSDVFVSVLSRLGSFQGDARQFRSWVFTIAYRRVVDDRRRRSRRPGAEPLEDLEESGAFPGPVAVATSTDEVALAHLGTRWVERLVGELSPDQRDVLALRVVADLSLEQVAATLDKTPGAVKALQRRALAALRRRLAAQPVPR